MDFLAWRGFARIDAFLLSRVFEPLIWAMQALLRVSGYRLGTSFLIASVGIHAWFVMTRGLGWDPLVLINLVMWLGFSSFHIMMCEANHWRWVNRTPPKSEYWPSEHMRNMDRYIRIMITAFGVVVLGFLLAGSSGSFLRASVFDLTRFIPFFLACPFLSLGIYAWRTRPRWPQRKVQHRTNPAAA